MSQITNLGAGNGGGGANQFVTNAGIAVPAAGVLNVLGSHGINTAGAGNTVTVAINNAITLGDLVPIATGSSALTATTGDITITSGNLNITSTTSAAGADGVVNMGGSRWIHNFGTENTFVGKNSGNFTLTTISSVQNVGLGEGSLSSLTTSQDNTALGKDALNNLQSGSGGNTAIGKDALMESISNTGNTAVGFQALTNTLSNQNTAIGYSALQNINNGNAISSVQNVGLGYTPLFNLTQGSNNLAIGGNQPLINLLTGSNNIAILQSQNGAYSGAESSNILIGNSGVGAESNTIHIGTYGTGASQQNKCFIASAFSNFGTANTFSGESAGNTSLTIANATHNTAIGTAALNGLVGTAGGNAQNNTALGAGSLQDLTNGSQNLAAGTGSAATLLTGNYNVILGDGAASAYVAAESSNIILGANAGVVSESNVMRLGGGTGAGNGQQNKAFISGVNGVTASNPMMVTINSATDQLGVAAVPSSSISITGDSGGALTGAAFTFTGGSTGLTFAGAGTTETLGGTLAIANGGTNATSMATSTGIVKYDGTRLVTSSTAKIDSSNRYTNTAQPAFSAYNSADQTSVTGDGTEYTILYNTSLFDQNSNFSSPTFTAPVTGKYMLGGTVAMYNIGAQTYLIVRVKVAGTSAQTVITNRSGVSALAAFGALGVNFKIFLPMTATDTCTITLEVGGSTKTINLDSANTLFYGQLAC